MGLPERPARARPGTAPGGRWNHNIHYHRLVLESVPDGARTALDVGTGNGLLAADLRTVVPEVTGIDADAEVLVSASREDPGVRWTHGDVLTHPFDAASFDVVASVATVHHLPDVAETLRRFASLTAPGGVVVVVGLARSERLRDLAHDVRGMVATRWHQRRHGLWEHSAPLVWPPSHGYAEVRRTAEAVLPGVRWRRLAMWRYLLVWRRPASGEVGREAAI